MSESLGKRGLNWLAEEGFGVESLKQDGFVSLYRAYPPSSPENKFSVSQRTEEDKIVIASGVFLNAEDQTRIGRLPSEKRIELVKGLSRLLYARTVGFRIDENQGALQGVTLTHSIYQDGLTKDRFMGAISDLYRTQAIVLLHLTDYIGEPTTVYRPEDTGLKSAPTSRTCPKCQKELPLSTKFCLYCGTKQG